MRALAAGFDGSVSALRTARARADALWWAFDGVSANDRSPTRAVKAASLLREVGAAEQAKEEAMLAVCDEIRRMCGALERLRRTLHILVLLLLTAAAWVSWLHL
jgi:hypothetical protein